MYCIYKLSYMEKKQACGDNRLHFAWKQGLVKCVHWSLFNSFFTIVVFNNEYAWPESQIFNGHYWCCQSISQQSEMEQTFPSFPVNIWLQSLMTFSNNKLKGIFIHYVEILRSVKVWLLFFKFSGNTLLRLNSCKVHMVFWEGHKFFAKSPPFFDWC